MLEIACFERTSAEIALKSVADRIEFCSTIEAGGLTPNMEEFRYLKSNYHKPIFVMIRPSGGSFLYSEVEFAQMKKDLIDFRKAGADGFVFGILDDHNEIDIEKNKELIQLAEGVPCTFHRAFDRTPDLEKSIKTLIDIGFATVLTSGGKTSAMEGKNNLNYLIENFANDIQILIGGGVRSSNIQELREFTNGKFFHSSAILSYETFANEEEIKKLKIVL